MKSRHPDSVSNWMADTMLTDVVFQRRACKFAGSCCSLYYKLYSGNRVAETVYEERTGFNQIV